MATYRQFERRSLPRMLQILVRQSLFVPIIVLIFVSEIIVLIFVSEIIVPIFVSEIIVPIIVSEIIVPIIVSEIIVPIIVSEIIVLIFVAACPPLEGSSSFPIRVLIIDKDQDDDPSRGGQAATKINRDQIPISNHLLLPIVAYPVPRNPKQPRTMNQEHPSERLFGSGLSNFPVLSKVFIF